MRAGATRQALHHLVHGDYPMHWRQQIGLPGGPAPPLPLLLMLQDSPPCDRGAAATGPPPPPQGNRFPGSAVGSRGQPWL